MKKFIVGAVLVLVTILFPLAQAWGQTNSGATNVARLLGIKPLSINGVPDALPIGSVEAVRSFIVGNYGLGLNVFLKIGFYDGSVFKKISTGKYCPGYESYDSFVDDLISTSLLGLAKFGHEPGTASYTQDKSVWVKVEVRYLSGPEYSTGLYMSKEIGPLATVTKELLRDAFSLATESITEQIVIPIPNLKRQHVAVMMEDGTIKTYEWTASGGEIGSPTWPMLESTTNGWVALRGWYSTGKYPVRITIETTAGVSAIYTEYGEKLVPPILRMVDKQTLRIKAARGSIVEIHSSDDNEHWAFLTSFTSDNAYGTTVPIVSLTNKRFFKAVAR